MQLLEIKKHSYFKKASSKSVFMQSTTGVGETTTMRNSPAEDPYQSRYNPIKFISKEHLQPTNKKTSDEQLTTFY